MLTYNSWKSRIWLGVSAKLSSDLLPRTETSGSQDHIVFIYHWSTTHLIPHTVHDGKPHSRADNNPQHSLNAALTPVSFHPSLFHIMAQWGLNTPQHDLPGFSFLGLVSLYWASLSFKWFLSGVTLHTCHFKMLKVYFLSGGEQRSAGHPVFLKPPSSSWASPVSQIFRVETKWKVKMCY